MILIDSTKYISWIRQGRNPVALLAASLTAGELLTCGIVRIEVLRGVIKPKAKTELTRFFDIVPEIPLTASLLREAAELAWTLDRQGQVLPVSDLLIATCARRAGATVITEDPHFRQIPGIKMRADL
jgi:predicted nucleic acid-binding protein